MRLSLIPVLALMAFHTASWANPPSPEEILQMIQGKWSTSHFEYEVRGSDVYMIKTNSNLHTNGMKIAEGLVYKNTRTQSTMQYRYVALPTCHYSAPNWASQPCESHITYVPSTGKIILSVASLPAERINK